MFFFIDESVRNRLFGLGCLCVNTDEIETIIKAAENFKNKLKLDSFHRLKYTLGDNDNIEKKQKEHLKDLFGDNWKYEFRKEIANFISSLNLKFVATLHEDYRTFKTRKNQMIDFYLAALETLSVDILYWVVQNENERNNYIVIDKPPQKNIVLNEKKINKRYSTNIFPRLAEFGFIDSIFISNDKYSIFLQLADFYIGLLVEFLEFSEKPIHKKEYVVDLLKIINNCLYPLEKGDKIKGIKTFHIPNLDQNFRSLLNLITI